MGSQPRAVTELRFSSGNTACAADLHLPATTARVPYVVMAHGFTGTRDLGLARYAARSLLELVRYRPHKLANRLAMPILLCVAERDRYAPPELARRAADAAPRSELRTYPIEHFDAYLGEHEALVADQVAFLARNLSANEQERRPTAASGVLS